MDWQQLSQKHPVFTYRDFTYALTGGDLVIRFSFQLAETIAFAPIVTIHTIPVARFQALPPAVLGNLIFHLGIIESFSYWKASAAPNIAIECGALLPEQYDFWRTLLLNGMGEYMYKNQIPIDSVRNIKISARQPAELPLFTEALQPRALLPIGGGKDSCVSAQILNNAAITTNAFLLNPIPAATTVSNAIGYSQPVRVTRQLDPKLLELNKAGYLNGHTPFSAYLAFLSVLCAVLFDYNDIVLSNENSANQGNVVYGGIPINHQYSKTFAFEKSFHEYAQRYLATSVNYFSFLRPVTELQIAKLFAKYPELFPTFRSCNVGQKENAWCGKCAKCLFVAIMLTPFIGQSETTTIMGKNLFADQTLLPMLQELLGIKDTKPFECVGTYEEVRAGLYLCQQQGVAGALIDYFTTDVAPKYPNLANESETILQSWQTENLVPENYQAILKDALHG